MYYNYCNICNNTYIYNINIYILGSYGCYKSVTNVLQNVTK